MDALQLLFACGVVAQDSPREINRHVEILLRLRFALDFRSTVLRGIDA
jgi:hypothetical protein